MDRQLQDFKWFKRYNRKLYAKYGNSYLAIKNKKVLGVFSSYAEGVRETAKTEVLGTFIVQHCTGDKFGYTEYIN